MTKLFVIDDEEFTRDCIAYQIDWNIYNVEVIGTAVNGKDALRKIRDCPPDIIITDIKMPVMGGIELLEQVKKEFPETELIMLSGFGEFEFAQKALNLGARKFFLKPVEPEELVQAVIALAEKNKDSETQNMFKGLLGERMENEEKPNETIAQIQEYIICNYQKPELSLAWIAERFNFSAAYLSTLFKNHCGTNLTNYINQIRIEAACQMLKKKTYKVSYVSDQVGYSNTTYFCTVFKRLKGCSPKEYRERSGGQG